jgi:hypothetical protein
MWSTNDLSSDVGNKSRILYRKKCCALLSKFAVLQISAVPFSDIQAAMLVLLAETRGGQWHAMTRVERTG